ncbi:hypothetical protein AVEN_109583-1 [Araneus ventricosus]|uniref:Uncharacterized protein n=1 Tax=Araneus ventricosus TaxID=182803 RepID=A0A4Y2K1Q6_ARAVE|nr:hypothetical protein AVEN_57682-1 [Araneus ventricosus]GBM96300.1 hypothetical protein AVEN_109583-1 [Araneus ventricosus]
MNNKDDEQTPGRPDHLILIRVTSGCGGYLKDVVFSTPIAHLAELKARIVQHILNMTPETLRSVVEHAVSRFQLVAENGGQHIEHVLHQSCEI